LKSFDIVFIGGWASTNNLWRFLDLESFYCAEKYFIDWTDALPGERMDTLTGALLKARQDGKPGQHALKEARPDTCFGAWPETRHDTLPAAWEGTLTNVRPNTRSDAWPDNLMYNFSNNTVVIGWSLGALLAMEIAILQGENAPNKNAHWDRAPNNIVPNNIAPNSIVSNNIVSNNIVPNNIVPNKNISALILLSPTARLLNDKGYKGVEPAVIKEMIEKLPVDKQAVLKTFARMCFYPCRDRAAVQDYIGRASSIPEEVLLKGLKYLEKTDLRKKVNKIDVPVLMIHGKEDCVVPVENARYLHKRLSCSKLIEVPRMGHSLVISASELIMQKIGDFLK
jgi:pimeloyl-ACP methyl ester carboxylesterase